MDEVTEIANRHGRMMAIIDMRGKGFSYAVIGEKFGITGQRVRMLVGNYEREHKMHMMLLQSQFETLKHIAGR